MFVNSFLLISPKKRLWLLIAITVVFMAIFLFYELKGNISYALNRRVWILGTMIIVAFCAGISTVLFQTITNNRILSPAIMGFEMLFILIQSILMFVWGYRQLSFLTPILKFSIETFMMITFSLLVYLWVFRSRNNNLFIVLLIGIIYGSFFTSLSSLMQRLMDPDEFAIVQAHMFATFNILPSTTLIAVSAVVCGIVAIIIWRINRSADVLLLGRESAVSLGINYNHLISIILILVSILVSISTALVGPLTFFGFLVANLTYQYINAYQHRYLLPIACLIGVIALVGGQFILGNIFGMMTALSIIINFSGGLLFIIILLKKASL